MRCVASHYVTILSFLMYSRGARPLEAIQGLDKEEKKQPLVTKQYYIMTTVFINNTIYINVSEPLVNMTWNPVAMTTTPCPTPDAAFLARIKAITLAVVGLVGLLIVGFLLCCMFYKNERLLNQLPWRRREEEDEHVFDMATMLAQTAAVEFGVDVDDILKDGAKGVIPYLEVLQQSSQDATENTLEGALEAAAAPEVTSTELASDLEVVVEDPSMTSQSDNPLPGIPHVLAHYSEPILPPAQPSPTPTQTISMRRPPRSMKQVARAVIMADSFRVMSMRPPPSSDMSRASSHMGLSSASDNTPVGGLGLAPSSPTSGLEHEGIFSTSGVSAPGHSGILNSPTAPEFLRNSNESLLLSDDEDLGPEVENLYAASENTDLLTAQPIPVEMPRDEFQDSLDVIS